MAARRKSPLKLTVERDAPQPTPTRDAYVQACSRRMSTAYEGAEQSVARLEDNVQVGRRYLAECYPRLIAAQLKLANLEKPPGELDALQREAFAAEYDKLLQVPLIESVKVSGEHIIAHTDMIDIHTPGGTFRIGKFSISINIQTGHVTLTNKTGCIQCGTDGYKWHHPHVGSVWRSGICWGNCGSAIIELCAKHEYAVAVTIIVEWLQNFKYWMDRPEWITQFPKLKENTP